PDDPELPARPRHHGSRAQATHRGGVHHRNRPRDRRLPRRLRLAGGTDRLPQRQPRPDRTPPTRGPARRDISPTGGNLPPMGGRPRRPRDRYGNEREQRNTTGPSGADP